MPEYVGQNTDFVQWYGANLGVKRLDLERIKLFNALAENLNYSKTAELMHISQSALSRYIAELEMTLGTRLFERTTRKVELTPEGYTLVGR